MHARLPYALKILDIDNDRSLLNDAKNDNAHIQQKSVTHVRGLVGSRRYDTHVQ